MKKLVIVLSILLAVSLVFNFINIFSCSDAEVKQTVDEPKTFTEEQLNTAENGRGSIESGLLHYGVSELEVLRKVADEEGAVKTLELIDRQIAAKNKQLEKMVERIKERRPTTERTDIEQLRKEREEMIKAKYEKLTKEEAPTNSPNTSEP